MFVLRGAAKLLFGSGNSQETLVELPQGQLYLVRPLSPKGYSELLFKDASARIRRTAQDFQYQLVVQRVYEEGEAELLAEEEGEDADIDADILAAERDEKTFLLDEALHFRVEQRENGDHILAWRDLSGDVGDVYEFVCDTTIASSLVDQFELTAKQCQYERKYRKLHTLATEEDLQQFEFFDEPPIPQASPIHSPALLTRSIDSIDAMPLHSANTSVKREKAAAGPSTPAKSTPAKSTPVKKERNYSPPKATVPPEARDVMAAEKGELHFYDFPSGAFVLQADSVTVTVSEIGNWKYWLQVSTPDREWLGIPISSEINPVFNPEYLSFIFNQFTEDGSAYSWLLRFKDQPTLDRFQEGLTSALWEQQNEMKWAKIKEAEQNYVLDAFNDLVLEDQQPEEEGEEEEEEFKDAEDGGPQSEHYDTDEEDDDVEYKPKDTDTNKSIAVGYKHDRSFVVRGSKIGVFKHTPSNHLEFSTNISKVETPKGELFSPTKVMLHNEDRNLVLQKDNDPNKLYRMDLEYGKVVDEWKVHDDIPVVTFAPENKFAQMTHEPTFLGISRNALYRIDPRVSGTKLVDSQLKQYASKNDFSALATTEKGYIAVASNKGDIRLFDRLGINAKTHIPALGEPIIGLDVSADGRWVLATCRNYLLLVDALQHGGKNDGKLGFEKSFAADSKPQPRRLALTPEHVAQFTHETGKPVNFTPAKFNTGTGISETSIITATGPYIIEWNLKKVLTGRKTPYLIKRYTDDVKADDFKFGTDKNVIVALPHEVNMVDHTRLKKPTRESIAGDFLAAARRGSGNRVGGPRTPAAQRLRREDIVDSPY